MGAPYNMLPCIFHISKVFLVAPMCTCNYIWPWHQPCFIRRSELASTMFKLWHKLTLTIVLACYAQYILNTCDSQSASSELLTVSSAHSFQPDCCIPTNYCEQSYLQSHSPLPQQGQPIPYSIRFLHYWGLDCKSSNLQARWLLAFACLQQPTCNQTCNQQRLKR